MSEDKDYTNVLLEEMNSKFDLLLEAVKPIRQLQQDTGTLKEDMNEVKSDVKVIKAAVTDVSKEVSAHDLRIANLENA